MGRATDARIAQLAQTDVERFGRDAGVLRARMERRARRTFNLIWPILGVEAVGGLLAKLPPPWSWVGILIVISGFVGGICWSVISSLRDLSLGKEYARVVSARTGVPARHVNRLAGVLQVGHRLTEPEYEAWCQRHGIVPYAAGEHVKLSLRP